MESQFGISSAGIAVVVTVPSAPFQTTPAFQSPSRCLVEGLSKGFLEVFSRLSKSSSMLTDKHIQFP
jgi:hypothetical protein